MNSNRCHIFGVAILLCHAVSAAHAQDPRTLLVAPFQNISAQPSDNWIGAGIAETVATDLRRLPGVRVIGAEALAAAYARGGSPSQDPPRSEDQLVIARELGADLLVGGSYERVGDHVWVTAGLVDVQGGAATHVVRLDSAVDELFELQDRLVSELAAAVTPGADQAPSPPASTDPPPQRGSTDSGGHGNGVGDDAGSSLTGELVIESGGDGNEQTGVFTVAGRATVGVARASAPPVIDGLLDDPVWNGAVLIDQFVQTSPLDGAPVTEATQVWIAYDREHLYFGLYAHYTDTSIIRANRVDRDRAGGDDWIALMFDTFHDQQRAYRFSVNGYGVQGDAIINAGRGRRGPPGGGGDSSWNALFSSSGRLVDDGWTAEIAIPFKSLRYPSRGDGAHRWGFQVSRTIQHKDETVVWSPVSRDIAGFLTQMGVLDGLSGLSTSRNLEILPTFTGIQIGQLDEETGSFSDDDLIPDLGVNVKYGLTSDLTADFTVNPDFSQIESDRPQITVNQRFPLFFPELRPFFLEGQEIFDTPGQINLVHSRTIVDPRVGGKLTGKAGNTTLGVLVADDEAPGRRDDLTDPGYGKTAQFFLGRARYDLYSESYIGGIFTDREFLDSYSRVGGIDGRFRLGATHNLRFVAVASANRDEEGQAKTGPMFGVGVGRDSRHWNYRVNYDSVDPDFYTLVGFVRRVDTRRTDANISYRWWPEGTIINWGPSFSYNRILDHDGVLQDEDYRANINLRMTNNVFVRANTRREMERFNEIDFRKWRSSVGGGVNASRWISINVDANWGSQIRYVDDPFLGRLTSYDFRVTWRPTSRLRTNVSLDANRFVDTRNNIEEYDIKLWRTFTTYQFTDRLLVRNINEYNTFDRTFGFNLLLTYRVNAGTVFYIGYDDRLEEGFRIDEEIFPTSNFERTRRAFFTKLQYLFRY